ncbi:MAG: porin, partial [Halioglobus sp.]|nr:porin [Halioglobus sp.]
DLNQAWIQYKNDLVAAKLGRQRILMGTQRFVGGVGWRQNEQTYDGLRTTVNPLTGLAIDFSYVNKVHRIFGPDDGVFPADFKGDNFFLRADYAFNENHKVAGFGYIIDVDKDDGFPAGKTVNNSSDTYGVLYSGKLFDTVTVGATYAQQTDGGDSTLDYDTEYYMAEASVTFAGVTIKGAYEVLASDNGVGFQTPYATLHKFQGWADKFLVTPSDGIEDANISIKGKIGPVALGAIYHDFQAQSSSQDWGTELDLVATWPVLSYLTVQAKYANFDADSDAYQDTEKLWLTVQLKL